MLNKMKKLVFILLAFSIGLISAQDNTSWKEIEKTFSQPPLGNDSDRYGFDVAIDGNFTVIGAQDRINNIEKVYVLHNDGTGWEIIAMLTPSDGVFLDRFGWSVSISGDDIVVGAYGNGSAYVFSKPANGWISMTETAKLTASDGVILNDAFGRSVSISGDQIVVGADLNDVSAQNSGSAYVFSKPISGWITMTETAKLTASNGGFEDFFGDEVSISGDNIVIGARFNLSGSAYVFSKPSGGWVSMTETAKLTASDGMGQDQFGVAVGISGDNIVVGSAGSAYVFTKPTSGWASITETGKLSTSDIEVSITFGFTVNISDDNIVIGAYTDEVNGYQSGSAYIFSKPPTGWISMTETIKLIPSDGASRDKFGGSLSISGENIVISAGGSDDDKGSVYFFKNEDIMPIKEPMLISKSKDGFSIHSYPFTQQVTITFPQGNTANSLHIYNTGGKLVKAFDRVSESVTWNTQGQSRGVYYLKAIMGSQQVIKRFVLD